MSRTYDDMPKFLGLDLSLTASGVSLVSVSPDNKFRGSDDSTIKPKTNGYVRLAEIRDVVTSIFALKAISMVAIENYSFASKHQTHQMGELGGVVRLALCEKLHAPFLLVPPQTLKQFVCGKGNAKKDEMLLGIYKRWGQSYSDNNQADAFALAALAAAYSGREWWKLTEQDKHCLTKCSLIDPAILAAPKRTRR